MPGSTFLQNDSASFCWGSSHWHPCCPCRVVNAALITGEGSCTASLDLLIRSMTMLVQFSQFSLKILCLGFITTFACAIYKLQHYQTLKNLLKLKNKQLLNNQPAMTCLLFSNTPGYTLCAAQIVTNL